MSDVVSGDSDELQIRISNNKGPCRRSVGSILSSGCIMLRFFRMHQPNLNWIQAALRSVPASSTRLDIATNISRNISNHINDPAITDGLLTVLATVAANDVSYNTSSSTMVTTPIEATPS